MYKVVYMGFPGSSAGEKSSCYTGDPGSIPGSERSPGKGIGYPFQYSWASLVAQMVRIHLQCGRPGFGPCWEDPLEKGTVQYSCLANSTDRGAWQVTVCRVSKSRTQLSNFHFTYMCVYIYSFSLQVIRQY